MEQDQVNTALHVQGIVMQSYRACSKGTIAALEVVSAVEFNGGSVDVMIRDANGNPRALKTFTADNYNGTSLYLGDLAIPTLKHDDFTIMVKTFGNAECIMPGTDNADQFVGDLRVNGAIESKNIKFLPTSVARPATSTKWRWTATATARIRTVRLPTPMPALLPASTSASKATASLPSVSARAS